MKSNNYTIFSQQFNDISHPWRQKNREPLPTALYPISRYSGARYKGGSLYIAQNKHLKETKYLLILYPISRFHVFHVSAEDLDSDWSIVRRRSVILSEKQESRPYLRKAFSESLNEILG